jgi:ATP-dependent exoDNAse (exonuclease V) beta subunit
VVWWDPFKLKLDVEGELGIRQKELLAEDGGASLAEYRGWLAERARVLEQGAKPRLDVFLASQAQTSPEDAVTVEVSAAAKAGGRPGGRRFGTLVHAALRDVALDAADDAIERTVRLNARSIGATADESEAARAAVAAALAHPLMNAARKAERCYREYPVTLRLEGDRVVEGVIDLAFLENERWIIVDFKTDVDSAETRAQYQRQLQWYAFALTAMTGLPARAVLLGV